MIDKVKVTSVTLKPDGIEVVLKISSSIIEKFPNKEALRRVLSVREQLVLKELERGFSNKEIGSKLGISERTVKLHASSIYSKTGLTRRQLVFSHRLYGDNMLLAEAMNEAFSRVEQLAGSPTQ